jgi:hypothetical protein
MINTKKFRKNTLPNDTSAQPSKNHRKLGLALICSVLLLGASLPSAEAISDALGLRVTDPTAMFPSDTRDFVSIDLYSAAGSKVSPELRDTIKSLSVENQGGWKFVSDVSNEATTFIENRSTLPWLGYETAKGTWGNHSTPATMYQVLNNDDAKKYMESEDCDKGFLKASCHGQYIISSGWLITGAPDVLGDYEAKPKNSLSKNETFAHDFALAPEKPVLRVWTTAKTVSDTLPADFKETGSQDGRITAFMTLNDSGFSLKTNLYDSSNPYYADLHSRGTINNDIEKLPANSVVAVAGSGIDSTIRTMLDKKDSFINTHKEWTELKDALVKWKVDLPQDLPKVFGTNTALSVNEGNSGNKVSGVLRMKEADESKIISLFAEAAKGNKDIINTYKIRKDTNGMVIESHDPKTDGALGESASFENLVGDTSKSVAVAYVDLDKSRALLDSTYKIPSKGYDKGIIGINITSSSSSEMSITMNWTAK